MALGELLTTSSKETECQSHFFNLQFNFVTGQHVEESQMYLSAL